VNSSFSLATKVAILLTSSDSTVVDGITVGSPILFILFFSSLMYAMGVNNAKRERMIAKYSLTPTLRKILFFDWPRFTLRNIVFQIYLIIVTAISIFTISLPFDISTNRVIVLYTNATFWPFIVIQGVLSTIQVRSPSKK